MNCKKCGFLLSNQNQTCPNCGEPNESFTNGPVIPTEPVTPVTPVAPVEPVTTTPTPAPVMPDPVAPAAPVAPEAPVAPVAPTAPVQTSMPGATPVTPTVGITQTQIQKPEEKKSGKGFIIIIIILLLIVAGLGTFIGIKLLGGDNGNSGSGGSGNNGGNGGGGVVDPVDPVDPVESSNTITLGGIQFTIPDGYVEKDMNGIKTYVNQSQGYFVMLQTVEYGYTMADVRTEFQTEGIDDIKNSITNGGGTFISAGDYVANGRTYYAISYEANGIYFDMVLTEVKPNYIFIGQVGFTSGSKDYAYNGLETILKTAKESSSGTFAPSTTTPIENARNIQFTNVLE